MSIERIETFTDTLVWEPTNSGEFSLSNDALLVSRAKAVINRYSKTHTLNSVESGVGFKKVETQDPHGLERGDLVTFYVTGTPLQFVHTCRVRRVISDTAFEIDTTKDVSSATNAKSGVALVNTMLVLYQGAGLNQNTNVDLQYSNLSGNTQIVANFVTDQYGKLDFNQVTIRTPYFIPGDTLGTVSLTNLTQGRITYQIRTSVLYDKK